MTKAAMQQEATITVSNTVIDPEKTKVKKIKIRPYSTDTAKIAVKFGATIAKPNYENVKVDVMISCPAYVEEIKEVFNQIRDLADELIDNEIKRINGDAEEVEDDTSTTETVEEVTADEDKDLMALL